MRNAPITPLTAGAKAEPIEVEAGFALHKQTVLYKSDRLTMIINDLGLTLLKFCLL
jgi:hypothetical protein